jgi:hypothetical protein
LGLREISATDKKSPRRNKFLNEIQGTMDLDSDLSQRYRRPVVPSGALFAIADILPIGRCTLLRIIHDFNDPRCVDDDGQ